MGVLRSFVAREGIGRAARSLLGRLEPLSPYQKSRGGELFLHVAEVNYGHLPQLWGPIRFPSVSHRLSPPPTRTFAWSKARRTNLTPSRPAQRLQSWPPPRSFDGVSQVSLTHGGVSRAVFSGRQGGAASPLCAGRYYYGGGATRHSRRGRFGRALHPQTRSSPVSFVRPPAPAVSESHPRALGCATRGAVRPVFPRR